jgi:hypothetical protein
MAAWITENTDAGTRFATYDTGALAYGITPRPVIDLSGRLADNPLDEDFITRNAPDGLIIRDATDVPWPGFATTYANVYTDDALGLRVFLRVVNFTSLTERALTGKAVRDGALNFSERLGRDEIQLVGVAFAEQIRPGDLVRARLDWRLRYPPYAGLEVEMRLDMFAGTAQHVSPVRAARRSPNRRSVAVRDRDGVGRRVRRVPGSRDGDIAETIGL